MYQVLYRKWRPQTFSDVYGQNHITETLMNAVSSDRVSHAYLFTGSRGTGKTTCAKILAKAVNCEHTVNGNPCNECAACRGIDNGSVVDVVEIDAASNNGVDNIRDLREETNYMPSSVKYRVYIIDEVHMLSTGAFNALLKTLEEPPEYVKFILATTEVHKLPSTILSRCQRFDFKRISPVDIAARLKFVAQQENFELTDEAAMLIARISDGGMRDALSLLDRCASYEKPITESLVSDASGIAGKEHIYSLVEAVKNRDCKSALETLNLLYENSCDMERLFSELISHYRNMMIALTVPSYKDLILASDSEVQKIKEQAQTLTLSSVISSMEILNNAIYELKKGSNKKITAEMVMIKLCSPELLSDNAALLRRISELEKKAEAGFPSSNKSQAATEESKSKINIQSEEKSKNQNLNFVKPEIKSESIKTQTPISRQMQSDVNLPKISDDNAENRTPFTKWSDILEAVQKSDPMLMSFLNNSTAYIKDGYMCIKSANPILQQFISKKDHYQAVQTAIRDTIGEDLKITIVSSSAPVQSQKSTSEQTVSPLDSLLERAKGLNIQIIEQ